MRALGGAAALAVAVAAAGPAPAQTARVVSGEHDGFTRLAVILPRPAGWQFGRTPEGYRLLLQGAPPSWALDDVFRPLSQGRLAAIGADPATGALDIGLRCACHADAFEVRPGIVAIDLRDGPPPAGSPFERDGAGRLMPPLPLRVEIRPRPRPAPAGDAAAPVGVAQAPTAPAETALAAALPASRGTSAELPSAGYDWLAMRSPLPPGRARLASVPAAPAAPGTGSAEPGPDGPAMASRSVPADEGTTGRSTGGVPASPLRGGHAAAAEPRAPAAATDEVRRALVEEMARAAAAGTIELSTRSPPGSNGPLPPLGAPNLRIGATPAGEDQPGEDAGLTAAGDPCLPDSAADLAAWGGNGPPAVALGAARAPLLGEFDEADAAAAAALVRLYLHLGFGAEARQAAAAFAPAATERGVWDSLSRLVDGATDPGGAFDGQAACESSAALWAVLSRENLPPDGQRNDAAVLRAFSALPIHLRRHLGPPLADRYLARGLDSPAAAILAAIERAPGDDAPATALLRADLAQRAGTPPDTATLREVAASNGDPAVGATIALIETAAATGAVPTDLRLSAEALARSRRGTAEATALGAAVALAHASQGDFDAAFSLSAPGSAEAVPLWRLLAERGSDGAVLAHAVRSGPPSLPADLRLALAARLIRLGFAEPALGWLGPDMRDDDAARLRAEAELLRGDARAALAVLGDLNDDAAGALRRAAQQRLDPSVPGEGADEAARQRAAVLSRDWAAVAAGGADLWAAAARRIDPVPADEGAGPLARGRALVADSAAARAAIGDLLAATTVPPAGDAAP